jgi:hypothetical protein
MGERAAGFRRPAAHVALTGRGGDDRIFVRSRRRHAARMQPTDAEARRATELPSVVSTPTAAGHSDTSNVRFIAMLGLGSLGFLTLLASFTLASGPAWRRPELALFLLPTLFLLGALASVSASSGDRGGDGRRVERPRSRAEPRSRVDRGQASATSGLSPASAPSPFTSARPADPRLRDRIRGHRLPSRWGSGGSRRGHDVLASRRRDPACHRSPRRSASTVSSSSGCRSWQPARRSLARQPRSEARSSSRAACSRRR